MAKANQDLQANPAVSTPATVTPSVQNNRRDREGVPFEQLSPEVQASVLERFRFIYYTSPDFKAAQCDVATKLLKGTLGCTVTFFKMSGDRETGLPDVIFSYDGIAPKHWEDFVKNYEGMLEEDAQIILAKKNALHFFKHYDKNGHEYSIGPKADLGHLTNFVYRLATEFMYEVLSPMYNKARTTLAEYYYDEEGDTNGWDSVWDYRTKDTSFIASVFKAQHLLFNPETGQMEKVRVKKPTIAQPASNRSLQNLANRFRR
jgi:hypothetical protein